MIGLVARGLVLWATDSLYITQVLTFFFFFTHDGILPGRYSNRCFFDRRKDEHISRLLLLGVVA